MYPRKSRLSPAKRDRLVEHFVADTPARAEANLVGVHRNTAMALYHRLRLVIADELSKTSLLSREVEVDESYFGERRKGKRGRGAAGKILVFGILKGRKAVCHAYSQCQETTLLPIIHQMIVPDSIVYTNTLPNYNALDVSSFHHMRVNHSPTFGKHRNHMNGIENFWSQAQAASINFDDILVSSQLH